eukprot:gene1549-2823_t
MPCRSNLTRRFRAWLDELLTVTVAVPGVADDGAFLVIDVVRTCPWHVKTCGINASLYYLPEHAYLVVDRAGKVCVGIEHTDCWWASSFLNRTHVLTISRIVDLSKGTATPLVKPVPEVWNYHDSDVTKAMQQSPPLASRFWTHDISYNRYTGTFIVIEGMASSEPGVDGHVDHLVEYTMDGQELWRWVPPLPPSWPRSHANVVLWDVEENIVYYNDLAQDTLWSIGRGGSDSAPLRYTDAQGQDIWLPGANPKACSGCLLRTHNWTPIHPPGRFLVFSNAPALLNHQSSSMHEVHVDPAGNSSSVVWGWASKTEVQQQDIMGGVVWLPNDHRAILYGYGPSGQEQWWGGANWKDSRIVQVSINTATPVDPLGQVVWELRFRKASSFQWVIYRARLFYTRPLVRLEHVDQHITVTTHSAYPQNYRNHGTMHVLYIPETCGVPCPCPGGSRMSPSRPCSIYSAQFLFEPFWRPLSVTIPLGPHMRSFLGRCRSNVTVQAHDGAWASQPIVLSH